MPKIAGLTMTLVAALVILGTASIARAGEAEFICDSVPSDICHFVIFEGDGSEIRFTLDGGVATTVGGLAEGDTHCDVLNEPADAATCDRFPVEGIE